MNEHVYCIYLHDKTKYDKKFYERERERIKAQKIINCAKPLSVFAKIEPYLRISKK